VLVRADLLIMLSDIDGLYTKPPTHPDAEKISLVPFNENLKGIEFGDIGSAGVGTGGAVTKVAAAKYAAQHGVPVLFTATTQVGELRRISSGEAAASSTPEAFAEQVENLGTWFLANPEMRPITESVDLSL
ncbi:MAG: hypothetical protein WBA28_04785, partial [Microbacteriaceae bacterium]